MAPAPVTVRVLVVDDDQDDCLLVASFLGDAKRTKFVVEAAYSPAAALDKLKTGKYDVLLVDWKLDALGIPTTGIDFKNDIEALHYRIPVVLITNHGDRHLQAMALEEGVAEYLEKGAFTADLLERTCLYAIGLHQQKIADGGGPGMGVMMEQLVGLTRDSIAAMTDTKNEISGMRKDFKGQLVVMQSSCDTKFEGLQGTLKTLDIDIKDKDKVKWALGWVDEHRATAGILFGALLVMVIVLALVLQIIDVGKIKQAVSFNNHHHEVVEKHNG